jgi:cellulose synthase/poly-beta-1,6-N-acetylglucosamine synthase-like glycosyltransferase
MGDLLLAGANAGAFLVCVAFLAYVVLILWPYLRRTPDVAGDASEFSWHLLVPCRDEAAVIEATVRGLVACHPESRIWCIDDASTDETPAILARLSGELRQLRVVTRTLPEARTGKGPALNAGFGAIVNSLRPGVDPTKVVVGVIDSGPKLFGDPTVGAVQIQVRMLDHVPGLADRAGARAATRKGRLLVRMQDLEFAGPIAAMQVLRRHLGSVGMGGNGQFTRLSALYRVSRDHGTPWHGALLEDLELRLHVLLTGGRTQYCHDTWVAQEGLPSLRRLVRQRTRWAQGSMQCARYLWPVLTSARISTGGAVEIAYFLIQPWLQLLGGVLYAVCGFILVSGLVQSAGDPATLLNPTNYGVLMLFMLFGMGPLVVWGPVYRSRVDRTTTRRRALLLGLTNTLYLYVNHIAVWTAFYRIIRQRRDWAKTDRNGPRHALPIPSIHSAATAA